MLVDLDTPYADTTAADLSLALDGPERPALYVRTLALPGEVSVCLRLLGASHQVLLRSPGTVRSETVACLPGRPPSLPSQLVDDDGRYHFSAELLRLPQAEFTHRITALRSDLADDPYALVGVFPGEVNAVTALRVRAYPADETVTWRTWHAYPQTAELVRTETTVRL